MSGDRNIQMGSGDYRETSVQDQGTYIEGNYYNNPEQQRSLAEAAAEIQQLLEQLDKTYATDSTTGKMTLAVEAVKHIDSNRTLAQRILSALKAGSVGALDQFLNHPASSFVISALEDWQQAQDPNR